MRLCVIGLGMMGSALIEGMLEAGVFKPEDITGCDIKVDDMSSNSSFRGIRTSRNNTEGAQEADVILLAVKPQVMDRVLPDLNDVAADKLVISVAAGITIGHLAENLPLSCRIIRVMPNTPVMVKEGASVISAGEQVGSEDIELVKRMLSGVGEVVEVEEQLIDAVTGLSGSGPAFIYMIIEAMADGGVLCGLSRELAQKLAAQTVLGAAKMVLETGKHPGELKDMVASPAGTTIRGIEALEQRGLRAAMIDAVKTAVERSREMNNI